jgi:hypothetical protein
MSRLMLTTITLLGLAIGGFPRSGLAQTDPLLGSPVVSYWHVWTDPEGASHQTRCELTEFEKATISTAALWTKTWHDATVIVTVLPIGTIADWHENPRPQWIIPLSGRWYVETMDGVRVEMGPGEMSFGEDQNTRPRDGKKGHLSGTVGPEPAVLMVVQFDTVPIVASACRFR